MAARNFIGAFELYHEFDGYSGDIETLKLPDLKWKTEDYVGQLGVFEPRLILEKLGMEFKTAALIRPLVSTLGAGPGVASNWKVLGSIVTPDAGDEKPFKVLARGEMTELSRDELKGGGLARSTYKLGNITYYEEHIDGKLALQIDLINLILIGPDGVDQLAARRRNLGRV